MEINVVCPSSGSWTPGIQVPSEGHEEESAQAPPHSWGFAGNLWCSLAVEASPDLLLYVHMTFSPGARECVCVYILPFYTDTSHTGLGLTLMTSS